MKTRMTNFDVNMYNDKIELLDKIITTLNITICRFCSWGHRFTSASLKELMDNPAEMYHKYLSFEYIAQCRCDDYGIEDKEYLNPQYQECFYEIIDEMEPIFESLNQFCRLLPHIKETYGHLFYFKEGDRINEPCVVETKNAKLQIMKQCAEYGNSERNIFTFSESDFEV